MDFLQKLKKAVNTNNSLLCVGLDPDLTKMPQFVADKNDPLFEFNKAIIDATADVVCAFKPNSAMYEATGAQGIEQLKKTCDYINQHYPDIPILLDYKRGDIGNTNNYYAEFAFDYLGVDAITISPYMGKQANQAFLDYKEKGIMVLCHTSNEGADEFQGLAVDSLPLYQHVAKQVMSSWNENGNCLLVCGATYAKELTEIRQIVGPEAVFLVPGVGAQGGDLEGFVKAGLGADKQGLIINSSREILYNSPGKDFSKAARMQAIKARDTINEYRG